MQESVAIEMQNYQSAPTPSLTHRLEWLASLDSPASTGSRPAIEGPDGVAAAWPPSAGIPVTVAPAGFYRFPGPTGAALGLIRALAEDPFHLDWPHW